jgi:ABC-type glycerol-3-phosphate transport system substrate-binding protein
MFAVNSNTKYRDEAWEFLKTLISKKQQASPEMQKGFPVNNEALGELADFSKTYLKVKQEDIDTIDRLITDVREYQYYDGQLNGIIGTEVGEFFSGNRSAEETAGIIQNKVELAWVSRYHGLGVPERNRQTGINLYFVYCNVNIFIVII